MERQASMAQSLAQRRLERAESKGTTPRAPTPPVVASPSPPGDSPADRAKAKAERARRWSMDANLSVSPPKDRVTDRAVEVRSSFHDRSSSNERNGNGRAVNGERHSRTSNGPSRTSRTSGRESDAFRMPDGQRVSVSERHSGGWDRRSSSADAARPSQSMRDSARESSRERESQSLRQSSGDPLRQSSGDTMVPPAAPLPPTPEVLPPKGPPSPGVSPEKTPSNGGAARPAAAAASAARPAVLADGHRESNKSPHEPPRGAPPPASPVPGAKPSTLDKWKRVKMLKDASAAIKGKFGGREAGAGERPAGEQAEASPPQWDAGKWVQSLPLKETVLRALGLPAEGQYEAVRVLKREEVVEKLGAAGLSGLIDVVMEGVASLRGQAAETGDALNDKFATSAKFELTHAHAGTARSRSSTAGSSR